LDRINGVLSLIRVVTSGYGRVDMSSLRVWLRGHCEGGYEFKVPISSLLRDLRVVKGGYKGWIRAQELSIDVGYKDICHGWI